MKHALSVFKAMLVKDLQRELRSREIFISGFFLSVILLCIMYFATTASDLAYEQMGAGSLWLCIAFGGTLGLNRSHQSEMVNGCYRALILAPVDGGWLYLAKVTTNFLLSSFTLLLLVPLVALFFNINIWNSLASLAASLLLGNLAFVALGTCVVVITANTRMNDVLFPVIQLPLVVPVLIAGVNSSAVALAGEDISEWLQFLGALNLVFLSAGFLLYDFLLEE